MASRLGQCNLTPWLRIEVDSMQVQERRISWRVFLLYGGCLTSGVLMAGFRNNVDMKLVPSPVSRLG